MTDDRSRCIESHLAAFWPDRKVDDLTWNLGPVRASLPNLRIRRLARHDEPVPWIYVTIGASDVREGSAPGLEFMILSPSETPRHVETLAMLAHFNSLPGHRLELGEVVNVGRPWIEGSGCDWLYMSVPYFAAREFQY